MSLILYHNNSSVCAAKVRVALTEKKVAWESRTLELDGDQFDPAYLALNPNAVVPTLVHNGRAIIESTVILEYLEDAFPERPLRPADPYYAALARRLMMRLDAGASSIHYCASVLTYGIAYRHKLIEQAGGTDRDALMTIIDQNMNPKSRRWLEDVVFNGVESPVFVQAMLCFDQLLTEFETLLSQNRWLTGDSYSISDTSFTSYMVRLELLQTGFLWRNRPRVAEWFERLKARGSASEIYDCYYPSSIEALKARGREVAARVEELVNNPSVSNVGI
jgi:glutathione S-transferase